MSWKGVTVMDQRVRFIAEYLKGYFPFNELCFQFSISRKTGYKWVKRYNEYGLEGLTDRARRPHTCASHNYYEVKNNDLYIYLTEPDAEKVYFLSSLDQFERHEASKNKSGIWEITLPPDQSFIYFFIVDDTILIPPCDQKVRDDFGSENCVYMPEG